MECDTIQLTEYKFAAVLDNYVHIEMVLSKSGLLRRVPESIVSESIVSEYNRYLWKLLF